MGLYIDGASFKILFNGQSVNLNMYAENLITNNIQLLSYEGYVLKDLNGKYLTTKEGE